MLRGVCATVVGSVLLCAFQAFAQSSSQPSSQPSTSTTQNAALTLAAADSTQPLIVRFGMDKLVNTFLFRSDVQGSIAIPLADALVSNLVVRQSYRGSTIRGSGLAVRDDMDVLLRYDVPLWSWASVFAQGSALVSADSRSIGLNRLQLYTLGGGVVAKPIDNLRLSAAVGGEYNEQLGITDRGWNTQAAAALSNQRFDEYALNAEVNAVYSALSNARTNTQTNTRLSLTRSFDAGGLLELGGQYTTLQREFYTFVAAQPTSGTAPAVETRLERLLRFNARLAVPLVRVGESSVDADVQGFWENWTIGRLYRAPVEQATLTSVQRDVVQTRLSVSAALRAAFATSSHALSVTVDTRDEINAVNERFPLTTSELQSLLNAEKQRDNLSVRTSLAAQTLWQVFSSPEYISQRPDTLKMEFSSSLLRYDTPSANNFDDRDELSLVANASYTHHFSSRFSGTLLAETRLFHLVFLRAQRSAQNNWNRTIRLVPSFVYASAGFSARPQVEILANYTSFDFEDLLGQSQSFSLRQISYRDSLIWQTNPSTSIESRLIFRYFERGEFQWRSFSELPRDRNYELFVRTLLIVQPEQQVRVGLGGRVYVLSQQAATPTARVAEFLNRTIAPETLVEFPFLSGTMLRLNGWYEFQFDQTRLLRQVPNMFLTAVVPL